MTRALVVMYYKDRPVESHLIQLPTPESESYEAFTEMYETFKDTQTRIRQEWLKKKRANIDNTPPVWHASVTTVFRDSDLQRADVAHEDILQFFADVRYDRETATFNPVGIPVGKAVVPKTFQREFPSRKR